jgi:hypothetical protein
VGMIFKKRYYDQAFIDEEDFERGISRFIKKRED